MPAKKKEVYQAPGGKLVGYTDKEIAAKKVVVLTELASHFKTRGFDRAAAAKAAGLTIYELRYLFAEDKEFFEQAEAIKNGSDESIADQGRKNLMKLLKWRSKDGKPDVVTTLYAMKAFGGYIERSSVNRINEPQKSVDPMDMETLVEPEPLKKKVQMKGPGRPMVHKDLPPEEDYPGEAKIIKVWKRG